MAYFFSLVLHRVELTEHLVGFLGLVVQVTFQVQLLVFEEHFQLYLVRSLIQFLHDLVV